MTDLLYSKVPKIILIEIILVKKTSKGVETVKRWRWWWWWWQTSRQRGSYKGMSWQKFKGQRADEADYQILNPKTKYSDPWEQLVKTKEPGVLIPNSRRPWVLPQLEDKQHPSFPMPSHSEPSLRVGPPYTVHYLQMLISLSLKDFHRHNQIQCFTSYLASLKQVVDA